MAMRRRDILSWLGTTITDELVISRLGPGGLQWGALGQREGNLYGAGLGLLTAAGVGMAMGLPRRRVICIDSDGGILMINGATTDNNAGHIKSGALCWPQSATSTRPT